MNDRIIFKYNEKTFIHSLYDDKFYYGYDVSDFVVEITKQEFENIKIKEYNSRTKCSRFELIDI